MNDSEPAAAATNWYDPLASSLGELASRTAALFPQLVAALALLLAGFLVSWLVEVLARRVLVRLGVDGAAERLRAAGTGVRRMADPSVILAKLVFWTLMLTFVVSAAEVLGFEAVTGTVDRIVLYLPNVLASGLIVLFGVLLGRVVRNLLLSAAAAARVPEPDRVASLVTALYYVIVGVLAIGQLGIQTEVLVIVVGTLLGGLVLTTAIAFGLGARRLVTHILAGHFLRQSIPADGSIHVQGRRGVVERIGATDTVFRDDAGTWSVPNAVLLEEVVER